MFLCRVFCVPTLSVDLEPCRLLYVAGGTSKVEVKSSQELLCRQKSDKTTGFEWTVTSRHSGRVRSTLALLFFGQLMRFNRVSNGKHLQD